MQSNTVIGIWQKDYFIDIKNRVFYNEPDPMRYLFIIYIILIR